MTHISINNEPLYSPVRLAAMQSSTRKRLVLGTDDHGKLIFHTPSPFQSQVESILIKGQPGSGTTWTAMALAAQEYLACRRSIIVFDYRMSYCGIGMPNVTFENTLLKTGVHPQGIPLNEIDLLVPHTVWKATPRHDRKFYGYTGALQIPVCYTTISVLCDLLDITFPDDGCDILNQYDREVHTIRFVWQLKRLLRKYQTISIQTRDRMLFTQAVDQFDTHIAPHVHWGTQSLLGSRLHTIARKKTRKWINLALGDTADHVIRAYITALLHEIYIVQRNYRKKDVYSDLGILVDHFERYLTKTSGCRAAIHDLVFMWGNFCRIWRVFTSDDKLAHDVIFNDDANSDSGSYQTIIQLSAIPEPGRICQYVNRVCPDPNNPDLPVRYTNIRSVPPVMMVEAATPRLYDQPYLDERIRRVSLNAMTPHRSWTALKDIMMDNTT